MTTDFGFFITNMPDSRPADYCLGCMDSSVFLDFDRNENDAILLKRISFDGYGCCTLGDQAVPMNESDSMNFKEIMRTPSIDQSLLAAIVNRTITNNKSLIWEDALSRYNLGVTNNL